MTKKSSGGCWLITLDLARGEGGSQTLLGLLLLASLFSLLRTATTEKEMEPIFNKVLQHTFPTPSNRPL